VWKYTPRRAAALLFLAGRRRKTETAELLSLHAMASRGDPAKLKKMLKELNK
jgi:hypothetical protein